MLYNENNQDFEWLMSDDYYGTRQILFSFKIKTWTLERKKQL